MIMRMGCKLALGAAGVAAAGAFAAGAALGAAVVMGRLRSPGARWPAEGKGEAADTNKAAETPAAP